MSNKSLFLQIIKQANDSNKVAELTCLDIAVNVDDIEPDDEGETQGNAFDEIERSKKQLERDDNDDEVKKNDKKKVTLPRVFKVIVYKVWAEHCEEKRWDKQTLIGLVSRAVTYYNDNCKDWHECEPLDLRERFH